MGSKFTFLVWAIVAWTSLESVTTLDCYSCTAALGNKLKCENLTYTEGNLPIHTCTYTDSVCAKYVIEYGDSVMIHRSCQYKNVCEVLATKYNNFYSKVVECQTCYSNKCNSGDIAKFIPFLIFLPLVILNSAL